VLITVKRDAEPFQLHRQNKIQINNSQINTPSAANSLQEQLCFEHPLSVSQLPKQKMDSRKCFPVSVFRVPFFHFPYTKTENWKRKTETGNRFPVSYSIFIFGKTKQENRKRMLKTRKGKAEDVVCFFFVFPERKNAKW